MTLSSTTSPPASAGSSPRRVVTPTLTWKQRLYRAEEKGAPYAYIAPFFILFIAFGLFPLLYTAWISLYKFKLGSSNPKFIGFENYTWLFENPLFYNSLWKTLTIGILSTVPQLMIAIGLAHLLNYKMRARNILRVSMIMPYATSVAAAALVFGQMFSGSGTGTANYILSFFGVSAVDWRNGDWTAQIAIAVIVTWRWTGYNALIFLAGMQSISHDLYESASLDGANRWQQFVHITLPGLRPTILFTVVVSTIGATQLFGEPLLFGGGTATGGALNQYQTITLFMYEQGWVVGQLGRAAAIAWVTFLLIIVLVVFNAWLAKRRDRDPMEIAAKKAAKAARKGVRA